MGSTEYRDPGSWPNVHTRRLVTCPFTVVSNRQKAKPVSSAVTTNGRLLGCVTRITPTAATRRTATIAVAPFFPAVNPQALTNAAARYQKLKIWKSSPVIEPAAISKFEDILVNGHVLDANKRVKFEDLVRTEFASKAK